jgi:hypothetical protein
MGEVAELIGISDEVEGRSFSLVESETLIGREETCALQIIDGCISPLHPVLHPIGDNRIREDFNSTHDTFVMASSDDVPAKRVFPNDQAMRLVGEVV